MARQISACFFLLIFLTAGVSPSHQQDDYLCGDVNADTLVMTVVLFRHGARTPYIEYPTDPYNSGYWKQYWGGFGQLTQIGMEQHFLFGKWVRQCYGSFLNDTYSPKDLYIRSSDYDRTLQSVQAHLAGAYPPHDYQQWTKTDPLGKQWQPVPIHTIPLPDDYLLVTDHVCPPYDEIVAHAWANAPQIKEIQRKNQHLLDYIAEKAGYPVPGDLKQIADGMCDAVFVERFMNLTLPEWMNETVVEKLTRWKDIWIIVELATDEMVRYAAGEFVRNLRQLLVNKTLGKVPQKHIIFSAHDTTTGTLLAAYGDFDRMGPPYRSSVITELHYDKGNDRYFVKAFYRNDTEKIPYPLQIRSCGNKRTLERCYLDEYHKVMEPFTLQDKKSTCFGKPASTELDQGAIIAISVTSAFVVILVVATVIFLLVPVCAKRKVAPIEGTQ